AAAGTDSDGLNPARARLLIRGFGVQVPSGAPTRPDLAFLPNGSIPAALASLEDDDLASDDAATTQGFQVLVDVFELDLGDVVLDAAGFGAGEHLDGIQVVAP